MLPSVTKCYQVLPSVTTTKFLLLDLEKKLLPRVTKCYHNSIFAFGLGKKAGLIKLVDQPTTPAYDTLEGALRASSVKGFLWVQGFGWI